MRSSLLCIFLLASILGWVQAAPLFPDAAQEHWAADAVAGLAAKGLVEGYPDGTFKGDRAASRYELAMMLARMLSKMEGQHAKFLTRAELAEVEKLVGALREELEALGVRVTHLEERTNLLDRRVGELEKIQFSGLFETRVVAQSFSNRGNHVAGFGPGATDYESLVGAFAGSNLFPTGGDAIVPVIDMTNGRPLTNGTGLTSSLLLNVDLQPDENWDGQMRLFAYTSQGDSIVDAIWGVSPPYLANSFTGMNTRNFAGDPQSLNHAPFTRAGLDRARLTYRPYEITVTLGSFDAKFISPQVFLGQANNSAVSPSVLPGFGFHVAQDYAPWGWEVFGTRLADGNPGLNGSPYNSEALGGALTWTDEHWLVGASFLRAANQRPGDGTAFAAGQIFPFQQLYTDWVNPPGYFVGQLGGPGDSRVAGAGSTGDVRPISGLTDSDGFGTRASFGPQSTTMAGVHFRWKGGEDLPLKVFGEYAFSDYRSNRNSSLSVDGDLFRFGLAGQLFDETLDLSLEYRHTDPRYDPFVMTYPGTAAGNAAIFRSYHRVPSFNQWWLQHSLHNTADFPHNRKGIWAKAHWQFRPDGYLKLHYRDLDQVQTSLQDIRVAANSLGDMTPNTEVLGFTPGFTEPVFRKLSRRSFTAGLTPLENPRGRVNSWAVELANTFTGTPWRVDFRYDTWHFRRPTSLSASQGGSQNHIDYTQSLGDISVSYQARENLLLTAGYQRGEWRGHYDPFGLYDSYAIGANSTHFTNVATVQHVPYFQTNWDVAADVRVQAGVRFYNTVDHVAGNVFAGSPDGSSFTNHPFNWKGTQLVTSVSTSF